MMHTRPVVLMLLNAPGNLCSSCSGKRDARLSESFRRIKPYHALGNLPESSKHSSTCI
jgi:hypothetical protein